jgi:perosamine synthetase
MISLFHPYVPDEARKAVDDVLKTRWIGQSTKVDQFEKDMETKFDVKHAVSLNSGTAALETAYDLIDIQKCDEVITTPMTCTATNLSLIKRGAKIIWADILEKTMTIDPADVARKVTGNTKAIIQVHLGGIKSDVGPQPCPVVSDAAQALGIFNGDYTCMSFQAIKHITTGDGGMLVCPTKETYDKARLMRWFGIDREKKIDNNWQCYKNRQMTFDVEIMGYKRHMNDIAAVMGIEGLNKYDQIISHRKELFDTYRKGLKGIDGIKLIDGDVNTYWLCTVLVENRDEFARVLFSHYIETNMVHLRNDIYKVFGGKEVLPVMDKIESKYLCLPLNMKVTVEDVEYICDIIKRGW